MLGYPSMRSGFATVHILASARPDYINTLAGAALPQFTFSRQQDLGLNVWNGRDALPQFTFSRQQDADA